MTGNDVIVGQIVEINNSIKVISSVINNLQIPQEGFIHKWQELIGSFVGAFFAFLIWYISSIVEKRSKHESDLFSIQNMLTAQVNMLGELKVDVDKFLNKSLPGFVSAIEESPDTQYSLSKAFFPLSSYLPLDSNIIHINTGSNYMNAKIASVYKISQSFLVNKEDIKEQFDYTFEISREVAINKLVTPERQRKEYVYNINSYSHSTSDQFLNNNIPIFVKNLIQTIVALDTFRNWGVLRWKFKFDPKFKFIAGNISKDDSNVHKIIETYFKEKEEAMIKEFNEMYKL